MTNIVQHKHIPAKIYKAICSPIVSIKSDKYFILINDNIHANVIQNATQAFIIFSGIISDVIVDGNVLIPSNALNTTHEKLNKGIQFIVSTTATSLDFSIRYVPKVMRPSADPNPETASKI